MNDSLVNGSAAAPTIRVTVMGRHDLLEALFLPLKRSGVELDETDFSLAVRPLPPRTSGILHLNWPTDALVQGRGTLRVWYRLARLLAKVSRRRSQGWGVVWTVHNEHNHVGARVRTERLAQGVLARCLADRIVALSDASRDRLLDRWGRRCGRRVRVVPLVTARDVYGPALSRSTARSLLGLPHSTRLIVLTGQLREDKGVADLADAIRSLDTLGNRFTLAIVGSPGDDETVQIAQRLASDYRHVRLELRRLEREELRRWMCAADWLVLPYRRILNSGVAVLGLTYGVPMIAPRLGSLPEVLDAGSEPSSVLFEPADPKALVDALTEAINMGKEELRLRQGRVRRAAERYQPDLVSKRLLRVYSEFADDGASRFRRARRWALLPTRPD